MLISKLHRTLREDESGQALVVGALTMLVLAFAVYSTVQLGHSVNERIRVQNAADNAAFSTAAMVARSLNFVAWMNRTIASQYVAAMAAQSFVSFLDGTTSLLGIMSDLAQSLSSILCGLSRIPVLAWLYPIATAIQAIAKILSTASDGFDRLERGVDRPVALFVALVAKLNRYGMYGAQKAMKLMTAAILSPLTLGSSSNVQRKIMSDAAGKTNDDATAFNVVMGGYNTVQYLALFDGDSESIPTGGTSSTAPFDDKDRKQSAERLMAEITNASRRGPNDLVWESNYGLRSIESILPGGIGQLLGYLAPIVFEGATRLVDPMSTRRFKESPGAGSNYVFVTGKGTTQFTRGSAMASPMRAGVMFGSIPGLSKTISLKIDQTVGLQAANSSDHRFHCRYDKRYSISVPSCPDFVVTRPVRCEQEDMHAFDGITSYVSFNIKDDEKVMFGQRDFIALVNKSPAAARFPVSVLGYGGKAQNIAWAGGETATFAPGDPRSIELLPSGLNGFARSMVYYHRTGAWTEPPNLFNPYWRAKLGPLSRAQLIDKLPGIGGLLDKGLDHVLLH